MGETDKREKTMTAEEVSFLKQYKKELESLTIPTDAELESLYQKAKEGDDESVGILTQAYLPKIIQLAEDKWAYGLHIGDLIQEGSLAVFEALASLGACEGEDFSSYIDRKVEMTMEELRKEHIDTSLEDSRIADKLNKLADAVDELSKDFGNEFTVDDLAAYTGFTVEEMKELVRIAGEEMPGQGSETEE